ncbi:ABC transporter substrate-binding protein [Nannocystis bainbridge]|uniref:ABC transporter substrate-binding protein n=1 Tax=Nannocystis bainbridge TaxID=2995303 RepID=A0ABT5E094_9BACT|nr:ABC transporter substrate-binding protein [Nannocystis bainbridge]MDC0718843.1 ABC transporter substrate-binding protein [Nannocystis bainbridge]
MRASLRPVPPRPRLGAVLPLLAACFALLLAACGREQANPSVRIALNWFPEVEHGGYFAALVHGYYKEEGLDVEIVPGRPDAPVLPQVAAGRVDFAVADASEVLLARAQGAPVVAIVAGLQKSPRCMMVHEASGITDLEDLQTGSVQMSVREPFASFLRAEYRWPEAVQVVPYSGSIAPFLLDPKAVQQAYVFSEPIIAESEGAKVRCILVADLGFNPYASVLVTSEATLKDRRELADRVAAATLRGWEQYARDPSAANAEIRARNTELSPEILAKGATALKPLAAPEGGTIGAMDPARWKTLADQLVKLGLLEAGAVDPATAYDLEIGRKPK